jgi:hypothetical protein
MTTRGVHPDGGGGPTRRGLIRAGLVAAGGLVVAAALPARADAATICPGCGLPFGPLHRLIFATGPDPWWQDAIVYRESRYDPGAFNALSGAAGLAQFIPSTWAWGEERFGLYGSPFDPGTCVAMMNAFLRAGEYYHWNL